MEKGCSRLTVTAVANGHKNPGIRRSLASRLPYIEDLSLKGLVRTKLAKSFSDAAMGEFRRQVTYKSTWNRKHLMIVDRFFPSTQMCSVCGALNHNLTLKDREWDCGCGAHYKRDFNAACNVKVEGLRMLA